MQHPAFTYWNPQTAIVSGFLESPAPGSLNGAEKLAIAHWVAQQNGFRVGAELPDLQPLDCITIAPDWQEVGRDGGWADLERTEHQIVFSGRSFSVKSSAVVTWRRLIYEVE